MKVNGRCLIPLVLGLWVSFGCAEGFISEDGDVLGESNAADASLDPSMDAAMGVDVAPDATSSTFDASSVDVAPREDAQRDSAQPRDVLASDATSSDVAHDASGADTNTPDLHTALDGAFDTSPEPDTFAIDTSLEDVAADLPEEDTAVADTGVADTGVADTTMSMDTDEVDTGTGVDTDEVDAPVEPCSDPLEPNDTQEEAASIMSGLLYAQLGVCAADPEDFYAVELEAGDALTADMFTFNLAADLVLEVRDPSGAVLSSQTIAFGVALTTVSVEASGTHYVVVRHLGGGAARYNMNVIRF